mgnify:CR=1 FL=1
MRRLSGGWLLPTLVVLWLGAGLWACAPSAPGSAPVDPPTNRPTSAVPALAAPAAPVKADGDTQPTPAPASEDAAPTAAPDPPVPKPKPPSVLPVPEWATPLEVDGFHPASHAGPQGDDPWPRPVVVVVHGMLYRPEWECDRWKQVAGWYGWILCPRGIRDKRAPLRQERWTFGNRADVAKEIEAGLSALEARYPGQVTRSGMVLVGASLGANMATDLMRRAPGQYSFLVIVEGGGQSLQRANLHAMRQDGLVGVAMAMSQQPRRRRALDLMPKLKEAGLRAVFIDMKGAGHNYRDDFPTTGLSGMKTLIQWPTQGE